MSSSLSDEQASSKKIAQLTKLLLDSFSRRKWNPIVHFCKCLPNGLVRENEQVLVVFEATLPFEIDVELTYTSRSVFHEREYIFIPFEKPSPSPQVINIYIYMNVHTYTACVADVHSLDCASAK